MGLHHHRVVIAYHGCDKEIARRVMLGGGQLVQSQNQYDWLGTGIYFWEHGPERALDWARESHRRGKVEEPFVLGASLALGRCFDLTDLHATRQLTVFYEDLRRQFDQISKELPVNKPVADGDGDRVLRYLDCAVINSGLGGIEAEDPDVAYQTVRGVFQEGGECFPGSAIRQKTHLQIAVRDPRCILGYFLPVGYNVDPGQVGAMA